MKKRKDRKYNGVYEKEKEGTRRSRNSIEKSTRGDEMISR